MKVVVRSRENSGQKSGDKLSNELEEYFLSIESIEVETENVLNFWCLHQNVLNKICFKFILIFLEVSNTRKNCFVCFGHPRYNESCGKNV